MQSRAPQIGLNVIEGIESRCFEEATNMVKKNYNSSFNKKYSSFKFLLSFKIERLQNQISTEYKL